jgi:hypothetical protein
MSDRKKISCIQIFRWIDTSTMDWCSVYLTPQGLPKYIYLSPPLIFPTTYNGIRTKNRPVWITPDAAPIRWMGPIRNPPWEQKWTEGYVIVSRVRSCRFHNRHFLHFCILIVSIKDLWLIYMANIYCVHICILKEKAH